jgi:predicted NBD/HSP70 family sugar kinase
MSVKKLTKDELKTIRAIYNLPEATRNGIADSIGLSILKTSTLLNELEKREAIRKTGKTKSLSGRPSYIYDLLPKSSCSIGLTFKLDHFHAVIVDAEKQIVKDKTYPFDKGELKQIEIEAIENELTAIIQSLLADIPDNEGTVITAGISVPGMIDTEGKTWLLGLQAGGIRHYPLAEAVEKKTGLPVFIEDNARSVTYYEKLLGSCKNLKNYVVLYLGSGVGTGIVTNGEIYRGTRGLAGELGHIVHYNNTYRCSCGNVGCLETVLTPHGIRRIILDRIDEGVVSTLSNMNRENISIESILEAANNGDQPTRNTLFEIGTFLGDACTMIIGLFNPQKIVITGKTVTLKDYLCEPTMQRINQRALPEMREGVEVSFTDYQDNIEPLGVALFSFDQYVKELITGK